MNKLGMLVLVAGLLAGCAGEIDDDGERGENFGAESAALVEANRHRPAGATWRYTTARAEKTKGGWNVVCEDPGGGSFGHQTTVFVGEDGTVRSGKAPE